MVLTMSRSAITPRTRRPWSWAIQVTARRCSTANSAHDGKQWSILGIATQVLLQNGHDLGYMLLLLREDDNVLTIDNDCCLDWEVIKVLREVGKVWCKVSTANYVTAMSEKGKPMFVEDHDGLCRR